MRVGFGVASLVAASVLAAASASQAATVLSLGGPGACGESACFSDTEHSRTWSLSELVGSGGTFSGLQLDRSLLGKWGDHAVRITFETADGEQVASWGAWTLTMLNGEIVLLADGNVISWDQAMGDLKLKLEILPPGGKGWGKGGLAGGLGGGVGGGYGAGGRWGAGGGGGSAHAPGRPANPPQIVTYTPPPIVPAAPAAPQVVEQVLEAPQLAAAVAPISAAPEPGAWAMMLLGFFGAGSLLRQRGVRRAT